MKNVNEVTAPQQKLEKFLRDMKNQNKTPKPVRSHWPYDYEGMQAFEVEHNNKTFYFCFGSEGQLLQKKIL